MISWLMDLFGVEHLPNLLLAIVAVIGAVVLLYTYGRKVVQATRKQVVKWNNVHDALVGTGPIVDPDTGEELKPATKALVNRVAVLEDSLERIATVLERMAGIEESLTKVIEWQQNHEKWSDEMVDRLTAENEAEHQRLREQIKEHKHTSS